jgi:hypothetical protein
MVVRERLIAVGNPQGLEPLHETVGSIEQVEPIVGAWPVVPGD